MSPMQSAMTAASDAQMSLQSAAQHFDTALHHIGLEIQQAKTDTTAHRLGLANAQARVEQFTAVAQHLTSLNQSVQSLLVVGQQAPRRLVAVERAVAEALEPVVSPNA